jgi:hypothetical protein
MLIIGVSLEKQTVEQKDHNGELLGRLERSEPRMFVASTPMRAAGIADGLAILNIAVTLEVKDGMIIGDPVPCNSVLSSWQSADISAALRRDGIAASLREAA